MHLSDLHSSVSIIKDPFGSDHLCTFSVYCNKGFMGEWTYHGSVKFKNGDTEGEQKFKGDSLSNLLHKMENFMKEELGV